MALESIEPHSHTGGSSIVRDYRCRNRTEMITTRSVDNIMFELGDRKIDMMKVDVEGIEPAVVSSAEKTLATRRVAVLAVDYHGSILTSRGVDPRQVDARIRAHCYFPVQGSPEGGYVAYKPSGASA